jgi:hypothetical protein
MESNEVVYLESEQKTDYAGYEQDKSDRVEIPQQTQNALLLERVWLWRQAEESDGESSRDSTEGKIDIEAPAP